MQSTDILQAIGKDLSSAEQEFLKFLAAYENERRDGEEASFSALDCAFDLFTTLKTLADNHKALEAKFQGLQRAVRLYCLDKLSKEELLAEMMTASGGINIHHKEAE